VLSPELVSVTRVPLRKPSRKSVALDPVEVELVA
jgi:hypothetical protein